jgi:uncharacterized ferritin-like protein (DUF455 family)
MSVRTWEPFRICGKKHAPAPRSITSVQGRGDRLRAAAFAEFQAREAFLWAAETFGTDADLPSGLADAWRELAAQEDKHMTWLLKRLEELGQPIDGRPVSDFLWRSFMECETAERFSRFMASAEERGRIAGERFYETTVSLDPVTAEIFRQIAVEEIEHIRLAERYFPVLPNPPAPLEVASSV